MTSLSDVKLVLSFSWSLHLVLAQLLKSKWENVSFIKFCGENIFLCINFACGL